MTLRTEPMTDLSPTLALACDLIARDSTTPEDAGRIAAAARVRTLALQHLVPAGAPDAAWQRATTTFTGELLVPADGESITVGTRQGRESAGTIATTG